MERQPLRITIFPDELDLLDEIEGDERRALLTKIIMRADERRVFDEMMALMEEMDRKENQQ